MTRIPLDKSLGQHHLRHPELCRPAIQYLRPRGRTVLEIGPGGGVLTGELLEAGARVWAWELDPAWAIRLNRERRKGLQLVLGDAVDLPWSRLGPGIHVAGNLPYNVGTAILESLLLAATGVDRVAVMVQWEVAERMVAAPGDRAYGAFSVLVAARSEARLLAKVPRGAFRPAPKVDGGFVGLELRPAVGDDEIESFWTTVRCAFRHRRKTLRNSLAASWGAIDADASLAAAQLDPRVRAERLGVEELLRLHAARPSSTAGSD